MRISVEEFTDLCHSIFKKRDYNEEEIVACTEEIVEAQCTGRLSHGAALLLKIQFLGSKKEVTGPIEVIKETPNSAYIIGHNNIGSLVARRAMDTAIEKAKRNQIGIVAVNNKYPFILAGYNSLRAAKQGLIGISWHAGSPLVAPWGSADPIMGTNPISIAIPSNDGPVVLDMATSAIAFTEIVRCKKLGQKIPEGVAISKDGTLTTDPEEALGGAILPFGGYKGSGLGIIIQLLGGAFVGRDTEKSTHVKSGTIYIAIRCDLFRPKKKFVDDVSMFNSTVKSSRVIHGFKEVILPGELEDRLRLRARQEGVEIEDLIYKKLKRLSQV